MTKRVFRYDIPIDGEKYVFAMYPNRSPLHIDVQSGQYGECVVFWAEAVDDLIPRATRTMQVFGTGHEIPDDSKWWGTVKSPNTGLVWHLYEVY